MNKNLEMLLDWLSGNCIDKAMNDKFYLTVNAIEL